MERNGASHRITASRAQQSGEQSRGMRPANQWTANTRPYDDEHSHASDPEVALSMSVRNHPAGGYTAEANNFSFDKHDPEEFGAGPFKTPLRAQVAAESLARRTQTADGGEIDRYRRPRSGPT